MALYRLIVLGIAAVASVGFAQDVSAPVEPPDQGAVMDEQRVREIVREELAKILSGTAVRTARTTDGSAATANSGARFIVCSGRKPGPRSSPQAVP